MPAGSSWPLCVAAARRPDRDTRPPARPLDRRAVAVAGVPLTRSRPGRPRLALFGLGTRGLPPPEASIVRGRGLRRDEEVRLRVAIEPEPQHGLLFWIEHDHL